MAGSRGQGQRSKKEFARLIGRDLGSDVCSKGGITVNKTAFLAGAQWADAHAIARRFGERKPTLVSVTQDFDGHGKPMYHVVIRGGFQTPNGKTTHFISFDMRGTGKRIWSLEAFEQDPGFAPDTFGGVPPAVFQQYSLGLPNAR